MKLAQVVSRALLNDMSSHRRIPGPCNENNRRRNNPHAVYLFFPLYVCVHFWQFTPEEAILRAAVLPDERTELQFKAKFAICAGELTT